MGLFAASAVHVQETMLAVCMQDTAGQERFRTLTPAYYRGAHGVILGMCVCLCMCVCDDTSCLQYTMSAMRRASEHWRYG